MRGTWKIGWLNHLLLTICVIAVGCGTIDNNQLNAHIARSETPVLKSDALAAARDAGLVDSHLIYADVLPYVINEHEAELTWGFIELVKPDATRATPLFLVTYIDYFTGELIAGPEGAGENILDFLRQTGINDRRPVEEGTSPNTYNSFPWSWRLPMEAGTFSLSCGYNCGEHKDIIKYSTDWNQPGSDDYGHLLESAASGWVMSNSNAGAYGWQVLVESGDAGSGKRYYHRSAHMSHLPKVTPGWWINKGTDLGYIGSTGKSSGPHLHFEVYRGTTTSGSSVNSPETLPITKWPSSNDGICNGKLNYYNMEGSNSEKVQFTTKGCP